MLKKNIIKSKISKVLTYNTLYKSKAIFGTFIKYNNKLLKSYINFLLKEEKISILDSKILLLSLRQILPLFIRLFYNNSNMLIIGNNDIISNLFNKEYIRGAKNIKFYNKKWEDGILTNQQEFKQFIDVNKLDLVILLKESDKKEKFIIKNIYSLKIPLVYITNLDGYFPKQPYITYPIIMNNKLLDSFLFFLYLLQRTFNFKKIEKL